MWSLISFNHLLTIIIIFENCPLLGHSAASGGNFNVQVSVHFMYTPLIYVQQDATLHSSFISGKLLYMFRAASPPIIRSTYNYIYSVWYLLNRYCYLPLLWISWSWFECAVGILLIWKTDQYNSHITLKPVPILTQ